jgi:hypothetical protein
MAGMKPSICVLASVALACGSHTRAPLPRFENDYVGARAAAMANHLPLAVEIWAPW